MTIDRALLVGLAFAGAAACAAGCRRDPGAVPAGHAPAVPAPESRDPTADPALPPLTSVLAREPRGDHACPSDFPRFYEWDPSGTGADEAALREAIWLEPGHGSDVLVAQETGERTRAARCFASGPHRDLNLANWCCRSGPEAVDVPPPAGAAGLAATLSADRTIVRADRDLRIAVAVENRGPEPVELNVFAAGVNVLFLEVRDAAGDPVPSAPPATPPRTMEMQTIPPRGGRTFRHDLAMFDPPLPPGDYTVRVRDPSIASGELQFRVEPAEPY